LMFFFRKVANDLASWLRRLPHRTKVATWRGPRDRREGCNQRLIRRAFCYRDILTTAELMCFVFPAADIARLPGWRWFAVRRAAERYAVRIGRRRPLRWRLRD